MAVLRVNNLLRFVLSDLRQSKRGLSGDNGDTFFGRGDNACVKTKLTFRTFCSSALTAPSSILMNEKPLMVKISWNKLEKRNQTLFRPSVGGISTPTRSLNIESSKKEIQRIKPSIVASTNERLFFVAVGRAR